ncbi:MAG: sulfatase-like hydrolase/transferase [Vulcanisaeta sp.]|nr:sulfatase-like hydrolase/transferase [Vulcanisaeta sp.]
MKKPNIIILIIDTLREDYSSGLEALRELGFIKYENAIAPAPWTLPSHASLITGMYPSQHEIHESRSARTNEELANIARVRMRQLNYGIISELEDEGYETVIITANPYITETFGFRAGEVILVPGRFYSPDHLRLYRLWVERYGRDRVAMFRDLVRRGKYIDAVKGITYSLANLMEVALHRLGIHDLTMEKGSGTIMKILRQKRLNQPFLLLINMMEAHSPYLHNDLGDTAYNQAITKWILNDGISDPIIEELRRSYPKHATYAIKRAIEVIRTLKPYLDDTLVIITSDHGELLGDGGLGHGYFLKDGLLKVPLWIKWPRWTKAPRQTGPFISLAQAPSIIRAIINNEEPKIGANAVLAESFGIAPYHVIDTTRLSYEKALKLLTHRVRIYSRHGTATYNTDLDEFEEVNGDENELRKITKDVTNALQH